VTISARALAASLLRRPRVVTRATGRPSAIALTFDDGPSPWTAAIAAALEAHGCRGTFFLLGSAVQQRPEVVAALAAAGHELGNHLWSHADPLRLSRAAIRAEIDRAAAAIGAAAGAPPLLLRPPYCGAPRAVARAAQGGAARLVVLRSVDPADWSTDSAAEIVERVLSRAQPGDIVCLHDGVAPTNTGTDTRAATVAAVTQLVPALLQRGLRPVTVSELLA
jgi:peptidoglycan/xylan/chitin deacetylase (PgdA/CDA1 family)